MSKITVEKIFEKYPEIFTQKDWDMSQTGMCWGIECGDGWLDIIDDLCGQIMFYCEKTNVRVPQFTRVKEKLGILRVYSNSCDTIIESLISLAEYRSEHICEVCGEYGSVSCNNGWLSCLCDSCREKK